MAVVVSTDRQHFGQEKVRSDIAVYRGTAGRERTGPRTVATTSYIEG